MAPRASRLIYKSTCRAPLEINRLSCSLVRFTAAIASHFQPLDFTATLTWQRQGESQRGKNGILCNVNQRLRAVILSWSIITHMHYLRSLSHNESIITAFKILCQKLQESVWNLRTACHFAKEQSVISPPSHLQIEGVEA